MRIIPGDPNDSAARTNSPTPNRKPPHSWHLLCTTSLIRGTRLIRKKKMAIPGELHHLHNHYEEIPGGTKRSICRQYCEIIISFSHNGYKLNRIAITKPAHGQCTNRNGFLSNLYTWLLFITGSRFDRENQILYEEISLNPDQAPFIDTGVPSSHSILT